MRHAAAVALTLALTGCSAREEGPKMSRLKPGQRVIVAPFNGGLTDIQPAEGELFPPESRTAKAPYLATSDRAEVITDESQEFGTHRQVKIKVLSYSGPLGKNALVDLICTIPRLEIRPVEQQE